MLRRTKGKTVMIKQLFIAVGLVSIAAASTGCAERVVVRHPAVVTETVTVPGAVVATPVIQEKVVVAQPVVPVVQERVVVAQPVVPTVVVKKPVVKEVVVVH